MDILNFESFIMHTMNFQNKFIDGFKSGFHNDVY